MLWRFRAQGFKSLGDVTINFSPLTVVFGRNAAGKSNLLDALQVLSRCGTARTLTQALEAPARGLPVEMFAMPEGGLEELLGQREASFVLEACVDSPAEAGASSSGSRGKRPTALGYRVQVGIEPEKGTLTVGDEWLCGLRRDLKPVINKAPSIERKGDELWVRRLREKNEPIRERLGQSHTVLSDLRWSGTEFPDLDRMRRELAGWRTHYLDPRVAMRASRPPREVDDIGVQGADLAPFLYRLKHSSEHGERFTAVEREMRHLVPGLDRIDVELDRRYGTLDLQLVQDGTPFSSRVVSEGTLRLLALVAAVANPWPTSLVAMEEPENGVSSAQLENVARLLVSLALEGGRQVIVTTHSLLFVGLMFRLAFKYPHHVALLACRREGRDTELVSCGVNRSQRDHASIRRAMERAVEEAYR